MTTLKPITPRARDGRPIQVPAVYPDATLRCITGRGDDLDPATGLDAARGTGQAFEALSTDVGDVAVDFGFRDPTYVAGGSIAWAGAGWGDAASLAIWAPASVPTSTPGEGNCDLVSPGGGAPAIMIVPALAGDGSHTITAANAVPIPWGDDWLDETSGWSYWQWGDLDEETGKYEVPLVGQGTIAPAVTLVGDPPAPVVAGHVNLFTIPIALVTHAHRILLQPGDGRESLTLPNIEPKLFLPQWRMRVTLHNASGNSTKFAWRLDLARAKTPGFVL